MLDPLAFLKPEKASQPSMLMESKEKRENIAENADFMKHKTLNGISLRLIQGYSGVDFIQIGHYLLDVLIVYKTSRETNLVDDAALQRL